MILRTASQVWILLFLQFVTTDLKNITAESGQNVTLPCRAQNNKFPVVQWSRADLEPQHVLVYRNKQFDPDEQHPSFKKRVDLQDRQMKDGDASLVLKDVMINDTGTYECRFPLDSSDPISSINLIVVVPPGQTGGHTEDAGKEAGSVGLIIGLSVSAALLAAVVGFLVYRKHKQKQDSYQPPLEQQPA